MTRIFDVIAIDDYHVVIRRDDEQLCSELPEDTLVFCLSVHWDNPKHPPENYIDPIRLSSKTDHCYACNEIIATIGKRILGIPLIIQDNTFDLDAELTQLNTPERYDRFLTKYIYSEEDIRSLFEKAEASKGYSEDELRTAYQEGAFDMMTTPETDHRTPKQLWIKNHKKAMKQIKGKMVYVTLNWDPINESVIKTDNNFIYPVKIHYEALPR